MLFFYLDNSIIPLPGVSLFSSLRSVNRNEWQSFWYPILNSCSLKLPCIELLTIQCNIIFITRWEKKNICVQNYSLHIRLPAWHTIHELCYCGRLLSRCMIHRLKNLSKCIRDIHLQWKYDRKSEVFYFSPIDNEMEKW